MTHDPFEYDQPARVEPSADIRLMANTMRQFYVSLTDEGFNPAEALALTCQLVSTAARGNA